VASEPSRYTVPSSPTPKVPEVRIAVASPGSSAVGDRSSLADEAGIDVLLLLFEVVRTGLESLLGGAEVLSELKNEPRMLEMARRRC